MDIYFCVSVATCTINAIFISDYRLSLYGLTNLCYGGAIMNSTGELPATEKTISVMSQPAQIELSTNAKGQHQWSIKLYGETMDSELLEKVLKIDGELSEKFKSERD